MEGRARAHQVEVVSEDLLGRLEPCLLWKALSSAHRDVVAAGELEGRVKGLPRRRADFDEHRHHCRVRRRRHVGRAPGLLFVGRLNAEMEVACRRGPCLDRLRCRVEALRSALADEPTRSLAQTLVDVRSERRRHAGELGLGEAQFDHIHVGR